MLSCGYVIAKAKLLEGEDFIDTFAPVAKMVSVRTFLAVAVARKWEVHQLDVKTFSMVICMKKYTCAYPLVGFSSSSPGKVCRLLKSLYGLRQSPRNWFAKLTTALRQYGCNLMPITLSLLTRKKGDENFSLLVYVDEILVAGKNPTLCTSFKP